MLRPATPLSALLFAAFCLLLLSVLSTPIIKAVPLGSFHGFNFGVFGYCQDNKGCSPIEIGYDSFVLNSPDSKGFNLGSDTRGTLSAVLIVHPVAALVTLVMFVLAIIAHFHSPSHSARYLLLLFVMGIVNFLLCLLCFLVDVLLFVPHMAWGSYIVLAATILVAVSGLVSCAMRRTVVSRKARKKRIAENAEMSGENFYNRQAQEVVAAPPIPVQPSIPMISGANGGNDKLPEFAAFEKKDDRSSDERVPLTARSPSNASHTYVNDASVSPMPMDNAPRRSLSNTPVAVDQYGNPLPPQDAYGVRRGPSMERMNTRGRGGGMGPPGGYRGRGGYGGPGRGGYGGYGQPPPNGRGYGPPGRGAYGPLPPGNRGGYGPPSRGSMRGGRPPPPGYDRRPSPGMGYAPGPYGVRQPSPASSAAPGYVNQQAPSDNYTPYNADSDGLPRAESPPPLPGVDDRGGSSAGAVEMDAASGTAQSPRGYGPYGIRDSDADVAGMLAMQQARTSTSDRHDTFRSEASRYSQEDAYVPPRQAWNQGPGRSSPSVPLPLNVNRNMEPPPPIRGSPAPQPPAPSAGEYYEDVDPRFAEAPPIRKSTPPPIQATNSYESIPEGARSPTESEHSTFTSISQRGINPRWNPPPPAVPNSGSYGGSVIPRRPVNRNDMLLNSNPDFELPGRGNPSRAAGGGANMIPGSAYPTGRL